MIQISDIYVWLSNNTYWLWVLVPLIIVIIILRSASVR